MGIYFNPVELKMIITQPIMIWFVYKKIVFVTFANTFTLVRFHGSEREVSAVIADIAGFEGVHTCFQLSFPGRFQNCI